MLCEMNLWINIYIISSFYCLLCTFLFYLILHYFSSYLFNSHFNAVIYFLFWILYIITYHTLFFYFISLLFLNFCFHFSFYSLLNYISLDDWQVARKFLLELHGISTDLEISKITEISDFSCVIKPCRGSASFGVSKARSLLEAEGIFRDLLGLWK